MSTCLFICYESQSNRREKKNGHHLENGIVFVFVFVYVCKCIDECCMCVYV